MTLPWQMGERLQLVPIHNNITNGTEKLMFSGVFYSFWLLHYRPRHNISSLPPDVALLPVSLVDGAQLTNED